MKRPILFSVFFLSAAIASSTQPSRALCINGTDFSLTTNTAPGDSSFVSSSPADADSTFKLEVELGDDLDLFATESEVATDSSEANVDAAEAADPVATDELAEADSDRPTFADLESDSSGSAADLEAVDLEAPTQTSREDYLDSRASEINDCLN